MNLLQVERGQFEIRERIHALAAKSPSQRNVLVGIGGLVACGKSWLGRGVIRDVEDILVRQVVYLPFDLWINGRGKGSATYAGRFLLEDFHCAMSSIRHGEPFFVPRYDIMKQMDPRSELQTVSNSEVTWNGKVLVECANTFGVADLRGATGLFRDVKSNWVYSMFMATRDAAYVVDGTLIFQKECVDNYDMSVFVTADWALRVSRIVRRFNRGEVFGGTTMTIMEYVGWLIDEARSCADEEITRQYNERMVGINSTSQTVADILDLLYLREFIMDKRWLGWVEKQEVERAIVEFREMLQRETNAEQKCRWGRELSVIMQASHLIAIKGVEGFLRELKRSALSLA